VITDIKLWMPAVLSQVVRGILPFSRQWTPIISTLIYITSLIQSGSLEEVAYYNQVTAFIEYVKSTGKYDTIHLTGHSLGGGIAIISGAKSGIPAVALSGPNAMLSRQAFGITEEELNRLTFNIIPQRDIVPLIDDVSMLFQQIRCLAPRNDFIDCHTPLRSLCEVIYSCGTLGRPALCECEKYGYGMPKSLDGLRTFETACRS